MLADSCSRLMSSDALVAYDANSYDRLLDRSALVT
jgi:hypothetical protein